MPQTQDIQSAVKEYILEEFLPGEDPNELKDDTPLITGGILDSIATLKLVEFLEGKFAVQFQAHETDVEYLDTIASISRIVSEKRKGTV